jgi:uncharacterized lipoprotein YddW (UPF0748 family)
MLRTALSLLLLTHLALGQSYHPVDERPPQLAREFRAAWIATAYNIDWPSTTGLSAEQQQSEMRTILDSVKALNMNAVIFQVRPMCDALYSSSIEPWSHVLTGTMGRSPGYDPLAFCLKEAHARGIEVHAWFNPFRALCNNSQPAASNHISQTHSDFTKKFGTMTWCDPSNADARSHALKVILDVVQRYDIDGVHLDDYFYPYPVKGASFPDGKSAAQRRGYIDDFVSQMYRQVKQQKPWVRVGISPFGIWRPGVPSGIEAGLDSYEELAGDSRKWLKNNWVDYLSPQLYWRISPAKQSFTTLLEWWRGQGSRPVWPGIATQRIGGPEDRRPTSEISQQISVSRQIGRNWNGHIHWSVKSLVTNQGGIRKSLESIYTQPALVPPMTWLSNSTPAPLALSAAVQNDQTTIRWNNSDGIKQVVIQARYGKQWRTVKISPSNAGQTTIQRADCIAASAIDRFGNTSPPKVLGL